MWKKISTICMGAMLFCSLGVIITRASVDPPITVQTPITEVKETLLQAATTPGRVLQSASKNILVVDDPSINKGKLGNIANLFYGGTTSALRARIVLIPVGAVSTQISVTMQLVAHYGAPSESIVATSGTQAGSYLDGYVNGNYLYLYRTFNCYYGYGFDVDSPKTMVVNTIQPNSPAAFSGLKVGDRITSINDKKTKGMTAEDFDRFTIWPYGPKPLTLTVLRNGEILRISITSSQTKYSLYEQHKQHMDSPF